LLGYLLRENVPSVAADDGKAHFEQLHVGMMLHTITVTD